MGYIIILEKLEWQGLGMYYSLLCKNDGESISHLLLHCHYTIEVWDAASTLTGKKGWWQGSTVFQRFAELV
jgi:hypothetical protein